MKIYRLRMFLTLLLSISALGASAQFGFGKIEEIEAVQKRKLIVMIEEPRDKMLKRIAKKPKRGSIEDYKADLETYNENIKNVVEKFWPYNKTGIQYKTFEEIKALSKKNSKEYAVLICVSAEPKSTTSGYNYAEGLYWVKNIKEDFEDRNDLMFSAMAINTIEDFMSKPVFAINLFDVFPTQASLVYGVKGIEDYFKFRIETKKNGAKRRDEADRAEAEMKKRAPLLAGKTLLIREEWLDEDLTEENFKTFYPYPYEICDRDEMDEIVMSQNGKYAYGVILPQVISTSQANTVVYHQFVMDGADSRPMCAVISQGIQIGGGKKRNFTPKTIAKIVEQIKGSKK
jgi:hypothetical protein